MTDFSNVLTDLKGIIEDAIPVITENVSVAGVSFPLALRRDGENSYSLIDLKTEADKFRDRPERRKGAAKAFTLASFINLINRHKDDGSVVFAQIANNAPSLLGVIDYHELDHSPRFGRHTISYAFPVSPEWMAWTAKNGAALSQLDFAQWIEDHISELTTPTEDEKQAFSDLLQRTFGSPHEIGGLSRGLAINIENAVTDIRTLQSGEAQIKFEEKHTGHDGKPLKIPGLFMLAIPLFVGGASVRVPARLSYRKGGSGILWSYQLYRPEIALREALLFDLAKVASETGLPVFEGQPEA